MMTYAVCDAAEMFYSYSVDGQPRWTKSARLFDEAMARQIARQLTQLGFRVTLMSADALHKAKIRRISARKR